MNNVKCSKWKWIRIVHNQQVVLLMKDNVVKKKRKYYDPTFNEDIGGCADKLCTCNNGLPNTGAECIDNGIESCRVCNDGYQLSDDNICLSLCSNYDCSQHVGKNNITDSSVIGDTEELCCQDCSLEGVETYGDGCSINLCITGYSLMGDTCEKIMCNSKNPDENGIIQGSGYIVTDK